MENGIKKISSSEVKSPKRRQIITKQAKITADKFLAASIGDVEWLGQSLMDGQDPCGFDKNGLTPLHLAALHGRLDCIRLLIEKYDVDVNVTSATGWHPIHLSINKESGTNALQCLKYLLECGADVNCMNDDNVTVSHQAATEGLLDCLQVLIQHDAPVDTQDVRGHTPYDLAKLWSHKKCARIIQDEVWKRKKNREGQEIKKLAKLKQKYGELQRDALQQIRNEQEFYSSVTYGNWLEEKGLPEHLKETQLYPRERCPDSSLDGLAKRLMVSGGVQDCATRMQKLSSKFEPVRTKKKSTPRKAYSKSIAKSRNIESSSNEFESSKSAINVKHQFLKWIEKPKATGPKGNIWNPSTNVNSPPVTNIKRSDDETIHEQEQNELGILPPQANLYVKMTNTKQFGTSVKVMLPGGREQNAAIDIPMLPPDVIHKAVHGDPGRVKLPQDFTPVHIFDVKHKRISPYEPPLDNMAMHLKNIELDEKPSSAGTIRERMISTLNRAGPCQHFLV